jgi:hypothetical protein
MLMIGLTQTKSHRRVSTLDYNSVKGENGYAFV